ncbi:MAG: menaquinone biosynthesis decarboxylase [Cyanobacteriota bacterium]
MKKIQSYKDLNEFIDVLRAQNQLMEFNDAVSCDLEITEITDRASKENGLPNKAILFNNVEGYKVPVLMNAFGSYERIKLALGGYYPKEIASRIESLMVKNIKTGLLANLSLLPKLMEVANIPPKMVSYAPCQEVVITDLDQPILDKLPILKCWPGDAGSFITLPVVITKDPATGVRNLGMYRMQKFSNTSTGMHWHPHHDGAVNFVNFTGETAMQVAVSIGPDPAVTYAATAPLPYGIDETLFAGFLRNKPVEMVKCKTVDLEVPANSQIVLEGYVDLKERRVEGPFGDHTGYYSLADKFPVFNITAMTHRNDFIYPATIVGKPPQEDCYMGKATEQIFLPLIKQIVPDIIDINLPIEGVFHNCAIISIDKKYAGQARKVICAVWGLGQLMFTKFVIVVDKEVDVHNLSEVCWKVFNNTDPKRDSIIFEGPVDILDHAAPKSGFGSKMGIDATKKISEEGFERQWPDEIKMSEEIINKVDEKLKSYLLYRKG